MFVALVFGLLLVSFALLYIFGRMDHAGTGPLAGSDHTVVSDGTVVPTGGHVVALVDRGPAEPDLPVDSERCIAESRLVAALIAGDLDRSEYQEGMAELAAGR